MCSPLHLENVEMEEKFWKNKINLYCLLPTGLKIRSNFTNRRFRDPLAQPNEKRRKLKKKRKIRYRDTKRWLAYASQTSHTKC